MIEVGDGLIIVGDCIDALAAMPSNSLDSFVLDPPYGLEFMGEQWDAPSWKGEAIVEDPASQGGAQDGAGGNAYSRSRVRYQGTTKARGKRQAERDADAVKAKYLDHGVEYDRDPQRLQAWHAAWLKEALRVAKPGAWLIAMSGTRTYHRLACAAEDVGWEVRDMLDWLYGSGFPKSHNLGRAFDARRVDDVRPVCRYLRAAMEAREVTAGDIAEAFGFHPRMVDHWAARDTDSQPTIPTLEQWASLKDLLGLGDEMDAEVWRLNGRKGTPGEDWAKREKVGEAEVVDTGIARLGMPGQTSAKKTIDVTEPSSELAKKWQGWGTALKPAHEPALLARKPFRGSVAANVEKWGTGALNIAGCRVGEDGGTRSGRVRGASAGVLGDGLNGGGAEKIDAGRWPANVVLDEEAAELLDIQAAPEAPSRFFYCAKPSQAERRAGLEQERNAHPTVKPVALMRYFIRLVTPPGGVVCDPFLGSGSTVCGAIAEGFPFVGIERDPKYAAIAQARAQRWREAWEHGERPEEATEPDQMRMFT